MLDKLTSGDLVFLLVAAMATLLFLVALICGAIERHRRPLSLLQNELLERVADDVAWVKAALGSDCALPDPEKG